MRVNISFVLQAPTITTHHKPISWLKNVKIILLAGEHNVHDEKWDQVIPEVGQTLVLGAPFSIFLRKVPLNNVLECDTGQRN